MQSCGTWTSIRIHARWVPTRQSSASPPACWSARPAAAGEESFDVTVCSPEWLADACREAGGILDARHNVVVTVEEFDERELLRWFDMRVRSVAGDDWDEIGERLGRRGHWEFEDHQP